jgi:hypothetical protein
MLHKDFPIICGIIALLIFGHIATNHSGAHASGVGQLLMQGAGTGYGEPVNEQLGSSEQQAISALLQLGGAQMSYSSEKTHGKNGYLSNLVLAGYLVPNATSVSMAQGYSIAFYLPSNKAGFTIIAEPTDYNLRPFMIDENQAVTLLTPIVGTDPDQGWADARTTMYSSISQYGYYQYPFTLALLGHTPPLQVRMNQGYSNYVLLSLQRTPGNALIANPNLIYNSFLNSYLNGQLMQTQ